jgi:hypothetical protein
MSDSPDKDPIRQPGTVTSVAIILVALVVLDGLIMLAHLWLYAPHAAMLDWPSPAVALIAGAVLASGAPSRCHGPGWQAGAVAVLAATVAMAVLIANVVTATVVIWAIHPPAATGFNGFAGMLIAGMVLTLPVMLGSYALPRHWRATGLRWRDLLWSKFPRPGGVLGIVLGFAGMFAALAVALSFEDWLRAAYPGAGDFSATGFGILCMLSVSLFFVNTGPTDWRSAAHSVLGGLVVFEVAIAGSVMAVLTLRASTWLAPLLVFLLVIPVYAGAFILVGHRPGGKGDAPADAGHEGEEAR